MVGFAKAGRFIRYVALAAFAPVVALAPLRASAAAITWQSPVHITDANSALFNPTGTVKYADAFGISTSTLVVTTTGGSVTFNKAGLAGNSDVSVANAVGVTGSPTSLYSGSGNTSFDTMMGTFIYNGAQVYTLNNLTVGQNYSLQMFSIDDRPCCGTWTQYFTGPTGNSSTPFAHNANDYVIGTFVADSTSETFSAFATSGCGGSYCNVVNAMVVRSTSTPIPEPFTVALFGTGLFGLALFRRRQLPFLGD